MKKTILFITMFLLTISLVFAAGPQGIHEPGTGIDNPEIKEAGQGTGQGLEEGEVQGQGQGQRMMVQTGNYVNAEGKEIRLQRSENNQCRLESAGVVAECPFNLSQEQVQERTRLYAGLSNGKNAEIKIMPDVASETALTRLRLKNCNENCTIELKEVGSGDNVRMAYEMRTEKEARVFGLFKARMNVNAQVDAETGEVIQSAKPWWAFLASESED